MRSTHSGGLTTLALGAMLAVAAACSDEDSGTGPALGITPSEASVSVGGSVQLTALNAKGTVSWSSSDETVASVVSTGFVTGKQPGQVTITASDSHGSVKATITVRRPAAIGLSASSLAFTVVSGGAVATQTVQITDAGDDKVTNLSVGAIAFTGGQPGGWLSATLSAASAPSELSVHVTPTSLPPGTYSATISVAATGATNSPETVVVTATVEAAPTLVMSTASLTFNGIRGSADPAPQTVNVTNGGTGSITALAATVTYGSGQPNGWLAASLSATSTPAVLTLTPSLGALTDGTFSATVSVSGTGAVNSPRQVTVTLAVGPGPSIALSTTDVSFQTPVGVNPAAQTVRITNAGGGTLNGLAVTVMTATGGYPFIWLINGSLDGTTAPATLTLRPEVRRLGPGTYSATLAVTSPAASNSPRTITMTLRVGPPPALVLGTTSVSMSASRGGQSSNVDVAVRRSLGGAITGLTTSVTYQSGSGWLSATLSGSITPATLTLRATAGALTPGQYTATVSVASPNAVNSPQSIAVTFTVLWSLAADVYPAIASYCTSCHFTGGVSPDLSTAANFYGSLVGVSTTVRSGYPLATTHPVRIVPGDAGASYVVDQVIRATGANPMPPTGTGVPTSVIDRLIAWISQGAPNN